MPFFNNLLIQNIYFADHQQAEIFDDVGGQGIVDRRGHASAVVEVVDTGRGHPRAPVRPSHTIDLAVHVAERRWNESCGRRRLGPVSMSFGLQTGTPSVSDDLATSLEGIDVGSLKLFYRST